MRSAASRKLVAAASATGVAILAVAAVLPVGHARARRPVGGAPPSYGVDIQAVYDRAGNPSLVANFRPDGALARPRWSICAPPAATTCTLARTSSQFLSTGRTPPGTVFEAVATYQGQTYSARSAPWLGTVHAIVSPTLGGRARYGASVTPHGARWTGGWKPDPSYRPSADDLGSAGRGPDYDFVSVEACRTRRGEHCVNLSPQRGDGFSRRPPVVGNWFTGWYVFALDQRLARDTVFGEPGYGSAAAIPPLKVSATVARSRPLGPVIGPPAPEVSILRRGLVQRGQVLVAKVRCVVRCHVWLQVDDQRSGSGARVAVRGSALVGVARKHLRRRALRVLIYVDSGPLVQGRTKLS